MFKNWQSISLDAKTLMAPLEESLTLSLMQLMSFVVWELSKLLVMVTPTINNNWPNGFVRDKLNKEGSMVDHKNYQMSAILGGSTQLFV